MSESINLLELEKISFEPKYSPGIVQSEEVLIRLGHTPLHYNEGKLDNGFIPLQDLNYIKNQERKGVSVDRKSYCIKDLIIETANKQKKKIPSIKKTPFFASLVAILSEKLYKRTVHAVLLF